MPFALGSLVEQVGGSERGVPNPSLDMLVKLAKTLKTTPPDLLRKQLSKPRQPIKISVHYAESIILR